jgi:hypothetical protein
MPTTSANFSGFIHNAKCGGPVKATQASPPQTSPPPRPSARCHGQGVSACWASLVAARRTAEPARRTSKRSLFCARFAPERGDLASSLRLDGASRRMARRLQAR